MLFFYLLVSFHLIAICQDNPGKEEWIQLFNGKDFTGWDIKIKGYDLNDNYAGTFRVEDSLLKVSYDQYERFTDQYGVIFYKEPFSHYKIRVEYRFMGEQSPGGKDWAERNSGILLHCQLAQSISTLQPVPVSLEFQLLGGLHKGERNTGNLCTLGSYVEINGKVDMTHCINASSKTYHGDQWVTAEAIVLGDDIIYHLIEGDTVLRYQHPKVGEEDSLFFTRNNFPSEWHSKFGTPLKEGFIALQAESHPVHFRKVAALNLKGCMNANCPKFRSYYKVPGNCDCKTK